ncbi:GatB/YqeY domain-containing protein [Candidatus Dojkabacteria bacterium]|nr:GatB/YqeY domain-containing protein [Candidatus Dojkabacteria bacterium]
MLSAVRSEQKEKSETLKMLLATAKNAQIESEKGLTDADIEKILRKETKKIEDSIEQYKKMDRKELVEKEQKDLEIVNEYLPELMSEKDVEKLVEKKIEQLGALDIQDMGKVMGAVMKELEGKADGNTVKNIVQNKLTK